MKPALQLLALMFCLATGNHVQAGVRYWDGNGDTPGAGLTPTGTWGTNAYWNTNAEGTAVTTAWTANDTAVFSAGADATDPFTVFVTASQIVGGLTFEEGAVTISGGSLLPNVSPFPVAAHVNATIDSVLVGGRPLFKTGTGTLTLNGTNTYAGLTTVSSGVLAVGNSSALGTTTAGTTLSNGAALEITGGIAVNEPLTVYGTGIGGMGALRNMAGSNWVNAVQLDMGVFKSGRIGSAAGVLGLGTVNAGTHYELTFVGNGDVVVNGLGATPGLSWGGYAGELRKLDGGTLTINGLVTIRGQVTLDYEATMRMGADHRFGNSGGEYPDMLMYGVWDLNGFSQIIDGLYGNGTITNHGTSTLVLGTNGTYTPYSTSVPLFWGQLHGNTTIRKVGPNTQIFNGSQQYTGDTLVAGGTLELRTACSNSPLIHVVAGAALQTLTGTPLTVVPNQTLMGSGTITGGVVVATGGRISPGDTVGKLTLSGFSAGSAGLDLSAGGTNVWELAAPSTSNPGADFDQIVIINGSAVLGGDSTLRLQFTGTATPPDSSDAFWQEFRTWHIIAATNVIANFAAIANGSYTAGEFSTIVDANGVWLTFTPNEVYPVTHARIAAIGSAAPGSVTVSYTNVQYGTNYVLSYSTNLSTTNWFAVGVKKAQGLSDAQTDTSATNGQRYYRVYYVTP